jgi:signal transduction histidine kinase
MRLAAIFATLAAVLSALTGWAICGFVDRSLERTAREELSRRLEALDAEIERLGRTVATTLERMEAELLAHETRRLARLLDGGAGAVDEATRLAATTGLGLLTVLDEAGSVVSSAHWPQLAGLDDPSLVGLAEQDPALRRVEGPGGGRLAVVVRRSFAVAERRLSLVGGRWLDRRFATAVARGHAAFLFDLEPDGAEVIMSDEGSDANLDTWWEMARDGGSGAVVARLAEDGSRLAWVGGRRLLHDDDGRVLGAVVVAVPRDAGLPARLRIVFLAVGLLAVALAAAAGLWAAARISRPVDRLVHAVDAIAAGEADYTFPARAEHEFDRLAQAFSRLQRSLEHQRRRSAAAERVAGWREVARRVAHEVKNPLVPIRLTIENLKRARGKDARIFDELFDEGTRTILEEVEQLRRLVTEFSAFARLPAPQLQPVDLHALLDRVLELHAAEPRLEVIRAYRTRPTTVDADAEQLGRAFKNVVGNAVEAMRDGERSPRLEVRTEAEGGMVEIRVCDSGPGIPSDAAGKVFEPYFTTKPQGTGLGMAIAYRIVTEHGGVVDADNRPEGGARIRIRLPLRKDEASP